MQLYNYQDVINKKSINCLSNTKNRYVLRNAYIQMALLVRAILEDNS